MRFIYAIIFVSLLGFTSCENETAYEVPVIADEFMTFSIDGQEITLNAIGESSSYYNKLQIHNDRPNHNRLRMQRTSRDLTTTMTITGSDLPITKQNDAISFDADGYVPVEISVRSNYMSGSIYCPHEEDAQRITYQALLRLDSVSKEGVVKGKFMTDPEVAANAAIIENGSFTLAISLD